MTSDICLVLFLLASFLIIAPYCARYGNWRSYDPSMHDPEDPFPPPETDGAEMKVIIAGSRSITSMHHVEAAIQASQFCITEVVSGGARGVDSLAVEWAYTNGVPYKIFAVEDWRWKEDPHGAGHKRNQKMADYADALIAIWDGKSGGTADMIRRARAAGLLVYVYRIPAEEPPLPDFTAQDHS